MSLTTVETIYSALNGALFAMAVLYADKYSSLVGFPIMLMAMFFQYEMDRHLVRKHFKKYKLIKKQNDQRNIRRTR